MDKITPVRVAYHSPSGSYCIRDRIGTLLAYGFKEQHAQYVATACNGGEVASRCMISILRSNVDNESLSDEDFRKFARSVLST